MKYVIKDESGRVIVDNRNDFEKKVLVFKTGREIDVAFLKRLGELEDDVEIGLLAAPEYEKQLEDIAEALAYYCEQVFPELRQS